MTQRTSTSWKESSLFLFSVISYPCYLLALPCSLVCTRWPCEGLLGAQQCLSLARGVCTLTYFSQFIREKDVYFLTSPNFFGRCQEKVGRCHFFPNDRKCTKIIFTYFSHIIWEKSVFFFTSPNFFGGSMFFFLLLPTFLGQVRKKLGDVITSWKKSFFSQRQKVH